MFLNSQIHISNLDLVLNILLGHRHASLDDVVAILALPLLSGNGNKPKEKRTKKQGGEVIFL